MTTMRRSLSSLGALVTFEAAARLESFTLAAGELGVTQAAVSRQIKLLEQDLGTPLFARGHRGVTLTPAGRLLASAATGAFDRVTEAIGMVRRLAAPDLVTVSATLAFAHFWLMPRLPAFRAAHPGIRLRLVAEDASIDLRQSPRDVLVRYGLAPFEDGRSIVSCPDEVFPVCVPALARTVGSSHFDLSALPLIDFDPIDPTWLGWQQWADRTGQPGPSARGDLRFSHYADTVYAALNGAGVALGWSRLITDLLVQGQLVRLGGQSVVPDERYHVVVPHGREPGPAAARFTDWLAGNLTQAPEG
ncbi:LysR family transcriptional regulator [Rubellimicrobium rubrum]|uniref:LysR family transcriptional regulator n=1 Tax=Rubellimicrobium rubrum TaxID=2585369 RepID=A0A5C4MS20_9RHOB|nr:LysR substrate-binding domain-containing protein [Rubellimicrobium rubrum]TNC48594.1 LysR family transcriptional regulator [Rubellimicrobium rubrum]